MAGLTPSAQRWLAEHHGVVTSAALRRLGVSRSTAESLQRRGILRSVHKGVLVTASSQVTLEQRCAILCAAHPHGFVTGPTAGMLVGLRRMPVTSAVHFSVRHGIHLPVDCGVNFRQTTALSGHDRRTRDDGIVVASWARLAFDLAADLRPLDHLSVLHQLLDQARVTVDQLVAIGRRLARPARPGSTRFLQSLERLDGAYAGQSHPEVRLADALIERGVPIERQARVLNLPNGRRAHIDLAVPSIRWGIELDIHPEHRSLEGHYDGVRRGRQLHLVGWQVEYVAELDLEHLERLADELVALYVRRRQQFLTRSSAT
jgi:hypothetical protein